MLFAGEGVFAKDTGKLIPSTNHCSSLLLPILFRGKKSFMGRETVLGLIIHVRKKINISQPSIAWRQEYNTKFV